ncbi:MAG: response regulator [Myxococcales bacterium]|nr:response regulator [Myxococcales bacterium]
MTTASRAKTILLVEDNPNDEALALRVLNKCGHGAEVVVARDGAEALEFLFAEGRYAGRSGAALPTVTLLDLKLPKLDGLEVLRRIRADERTVLAPVVVLTSSDEQRDRLESYRCGANSYVRKPEAFDAFSTALRGIAEYWLEVNEAPNGRV